MEDVNYFGIKPSSVALSFNAIDDSVPPKVTPAKKSGTFVTE